MACPLGLVSHTHASQELCPSLIAGLGKVAKWMECIYHSRASMPPANSVASSGKIVGDALSCDVSLFFDRDASLRSSYVLRGTLEVGYGGSRATSYTVQGVDLNHMPFWLDVWTNLQIVFCVQYCELVVDILSAPPLRFRRDWAETLSRLVRLAVPRISRYILM